MLNAAVAQKVAPGPKGHLFAGNMPEFNQNIFKFLLDIRHYGALAKFRFGPFPLFIVNDPETIHEVLVSQASKFYKARLTKQVLYPIVGNGLFTSDGDFWKGQRKLMQPLFHAKYIAHYAEIMTSYARDLADDWHDGALLEVDHAMSELTMRIISKALFDADIQVEAPELSGMIKDVLAPVDKRFQRLVQIPNWLPTKENRTMFAAVARQDEMIQSFIRKRRESKEDKGDLLSLLLMAQDEDNQYMPDKQVRDEAMTLFGAGHETTAVTLTWTWYLLSQYPDVEAKLHEELERVLGGRLPTLDDLPQLPYTEMVIKEAMRLYPPAYVLARTAAENVEVGGYPLKKDAGVLVNIYGVHRDQRFFQQPDRFDPERFSPENEKNIPKYAYLPFGGGPRVCIGNAFAMMEARLVLATLAQRFTLDVAPGHQVIPDRMFTLRPKDGLPMTLKAREYVPVHS